MHEDEFDLDDEEKLPDEPFHIEADIYDTGDYARLLVVPCDGKFTVVHNDEHLCTLVKSCQEPECWEQEEGNLDEELVERVGVAIQQYTA